MGRWTQNDGDEARLPEGMERVGYDADSQRYYFRDRDGQLYQGPEGAEYGEMTPVDDADKPSVIQDDADAEDDLETPSAPRRSDGYQRLATGSNAVASKSLASSPYRPLFPFFLIIGAFLLLVWRLLPSSPPQLPPCPSGSIPYWAKGGDSCWDVAQTVGCSLDVVKELNPKLDCDKLMRGDRICMPISPPS